MVDINTSRSALQAQLQANQAKVGERTPYNNNQQPRDSFQRTVEGRTDQDKLGSTVAAKRVQNTRAFSSTEEIEGAGRRVAEFSGPQREAPTGRVSQTTLGPARNQPLGQIVNILV